MALNLNPGHTRVRFLPPGDHTPAPISPDLEAGGHPREPGPERWTGASSRCDGPGTYAGVLRREPQGRSCGFGGASGGELCGAAGRRWGVTCRCTILLPFCSSPRSIPPSRPPPPRCRVQVANPGVRGGESAYRASRSNAADRPPSRRARTPDGARRLPRPLGPQVRTRRVPREAGTQRATGRGASQLSARLGGTNRSDRPEPGDRGEGGEEGGRGRGREKEGGAGGGAPAAPATHRAAPPPPPPPPPRPPPPPPSPHPPTCGRATSIPPPPRLNNPGKLRHWRASRRLSSDDQRLTEKVA
jgi:hypothetical protein